MATWTLICMWISVYAWNFWKCVSWLDSKSCCHLSFYPRESINPVCLHDRQIFDCFLPRLLECLTLGKMCNCNRYFCNVKICTGHRPEALRYPAHTDSSLITVAPCSSAPGLEARLKCSTEPKQSGINTWHFVCMSFWDHFIMRNAKQHLFPGQRPSDWGVVQCRGKAKCLCWTGRATWSTWMAEKMWFVLNPCVHVKQGAPCKGVA